MVEDTKIFIITVTQSYVGKVGNLPYEFVDEEVAQDLVDYLNKQFVIYFHAVEEKVNG